MKRKKSGGLRVADPDRRGVHVAAVDHRDGGVACPPSFPKPQFNVYIPEK